MVEAIDLLFKRADGEDAEVQATLLQVIFKYAMSFSLNEPLIWSEQLEAVRILKEQLSEAQARGGNEVCTFRMGALAEERIVDIEFMEHAFEGMHDKVSTTQQNPFY